MFWRSDPEMATTTTTTTTKTTDGIIVGGSKFTVVSLLGMVVEWSFLVQILGSWIYSRDSNLQFVDSKFSETGFHVGLSLKWQLSQKKNLKGCLNNLTSLVGCSGIHAAHARCFDEQRDAWLLGGLSQELTYATLKRAFKRGYGCFQK